MSRTVVAVGISSEMSMFFAMDFWAPLSGCSPAVGASAGPFGAGGATRSGIGLTDAESDFFGVAGALFGALLVLFSTEPVAFVVFVAGALFVSAVLPPFPEVVELGDGVPEAWSTVSGRLLKSSRHSGSTDWGSSLNCWYIWSTSHSFWPKLVLFTAGPRLIS